MYTYVASPYSHPSYDIRVGRFLAVEEYCARRIREGDVLFSPIVHCHGMAIAHKLPGDAEFWRRFAIATLSPAKDVIVLQLSGWSTSLGVAFEVDLAERLNKEIHYVKPVL